MLSKKWHQRNYMFENQLKYLFGHISNKIVCLKVFSFFRLHMHKIQLYNFDWLDVLFYQRTMKFRSIIIVKNHKLKIVNF
jgi:hypothetical protein